MNKNDILEKLKDLVCEQYMLKREDVTLDSDIKHDFEADSLDLVETIMDIEAEWGIIFDDSEVGDIKLISDVVDLIAKKIK